MATINAIINAVKSHIVAGDVGLDADDVIIGRVDLTRMRGSMALWLVEVQTDDQLVEEDKRSTIQLVTMFVLKVDGGSSKGDIEQLRDAYDAVHARLEGLEVKGPAGARGFAQTDSQTPLGLDDKDAIVGMICGWEITRDRTRATTGE